MSVRILLKILFIVKAFFSQLSNLNFIVLGIEQFAFILSDPHSKKLHLSWEPLYLYSLEDNDKIDIISEARSFVVGQILDAGFAKLLPSDYRFGN